MSGDNTGELIVNILGQLGLQHPDYAATFHRPVLVEWERAQPGWSQGGAPREPGCAELSHPGPFLKAPRALLNA